jgi:hypothetical protein
MYERRKKKNGPMGQPGRRAGEDGTEGALKFGVLSFHPTAPPPAAATLRLKDRQYSTCEYKERSNKVDLTSFSFQNCFFFFFKNGFFRSGPFFVTRN